MAGKRSVEGGGDRVSWWRRWPTRRERFTGEYHQPLWDLGSSEAVMRLSRQDAAAAVRAMMATWEATTPAKGNTSFRTDPEYRVRLVLSECLAELLTPGFDKDSTLIDEVCRWMVVQKGWIPNAGALEKSTYRAITRAREEGPADGADDRVAQVGA